MARQSPDVSELRRLIEAEQVTQREAAARLGCSLSCVERTCKRLGLSTQRPGPRSGPEHQDWKGGRKKVGRYWYVWSPTHPFRTKQNYVAEHRLVIESILRRFLLPNEVVHHRNGQPEDNRPENLEVFQSNAQHLKHELQGRIPNWTPEGRARTLEGVRQSNIRRASARDGSARTRSSAQKTSKA